MAETDPRWSDGYRFDESTIVSTKKQLHSKARSGREFHQDIDRIENFFYIIDLGIAIHNLIETFREIDHEDLEDINEELDRIIEELEE